MRDTSCACVAALAKAKQEALDALPVEYYQPDYDPVAGELAMLPRMFTEADLEAVVEERSGVLEVLCRFLAVSACHARNTVQSACTGLADTLKLRRYALSASYCYNAPGATSAEIAYAR